MSSSAPFSLHCIICYEAFDTVHRQPVVLPCGHTYLCQPCSERLTKCMECRVSLFRKPVPSSLLSSPSFSDAGGDDKSEKSGAHAKNKMSVAAALELRLPIPKNLVLMEMLSSTGSTTRDGCDSDDEVREGVQKVLQSNYGTFAVCAPMGLEIHRHGDAMAALCDSAQEENKEEDDDDDSQDKENNSSFSVTIVSCASVDSSLEPTEVRLHPLQQRADEMNHRRRSNREVLLYGQTVQVVSYNGEIAVLARNRGYLVATPKQLVKVGDAKDEACRIEGMLTSLEHEEDQLKQELEVMTQRIAALDRKLEDAVSAPFEDSMILEPHATTATSGGAVITPPTSPTSKPAAAVTVVPPPPLPPSTPLALPPHMSSWFVGNGTVQQQRQQPPASPTRVNFRTGMSGHMGLSLVRKADQQQHHTPRRQVRTMGDHRGIGKIGPVRR